MKAEHTYSVFGLTVASDLPLPELVKVAKPELVDVVVRRGPVVAHEPGLTGDRQSATLYVPGIARYSIRDRTEVTVDPADGAAPRNVRLYLLGSAFGALLHQRRVVPLHANAVDMGGKVVAFAGASGAGKSTLAAWFHDRGRAVLTDDVCALLPGGERCFLVAPGMPRVRLWRDAVEKSGRAVARYDRSWNGDAQYDKYDVPVARASPAVPRPLAAIYLLSGPPGAGSTEINRLCGSRALRGLLTNTYRARFVRVIGDASHYLSFCSRVATEIPTFEARRVWGWGRFREQAEAIEDHVLRTIAE